MPEKVPLPDKSYRRLSEGVQRARLVGPVLSARPPLVIVSAPSGYGKTVLAAQIASADAFTDVFWIECWGSLLDESIRRVSALLSAWGPIDFDDEDPLGACCHALAGIPDGHPILVVFDDAVWASEQTSIKALQSVMAGASLGSVTVLTTRSSSEVPPNPLDVWTIGAEELRLTDDEVREAWHRFTGVDLDGPSVEGLVETSGRHCALLSLLGRNASLMGVAVAPKGCSPDLATLLNELIASQLTIGERELLDCASVMKEGSLADLASIADEPDARRKLKRISEVVPLVTLSGEKLAERFLVHDLVGDALGSVWVLAERDPGLLADVARILDGCGRSKRALEIALDSGEPEVIAECVERSGSQLLKGADWRAVHRALEILPPAVIASRARLLLVKAEAEWAGGRSAEAVRQAQMAIRIQELSEPGVALPRAHALLACMRMDMADFAGIVSDVGSLIESCGTLDVEESADVLYAGIAAYGFLGDRDGLARCINAVSTLTESSSVSAYRLSRIDSARAIVSDMLEGDPLAALRLMRKAVGRDATQSNWRVSALANTAVIALELGDLEIAREVLAAATAVGIDAGTELDNALRNLLAATISSLCCDSVSASAEVARVMVWCEAEGARFSEATTCIISAEAALCLRRRESASELSERGVAVALETGSPVLLWLAELVQAEALLAVGEVTRPRETALRLLPKTETLHAMGHVFRAHMMHVMGTDGIPMSALGLVTGEYARECLAAAAILTDSERAAVLGRFRAEAVRPVEPKRAGDTGAVCRVRLFGGLEVQAPHGIVEPRDWGKRKARLLFAMLVTRQGTEVHRSELIDYLWPELDEPHGLNNFYVVWSAMKRAVCCRGTEGEYARFFENTNGVCRVIPGRVVTDLDEFTASRTEARCARSAEDTAAEVSALRKAIELYRGDVLPGDIYDDWFGPIRQRFRQEYQESVIRYAQLMCAAEDPLPALPIVIEACARDPLREDLYQTLINLEIASNQRGAAMETYMSCRNHLIDELGIDPSRETMDLYQQILAMEDAPTDSDD
jgi:DNA-binding SARP family transcriptional activator